MESLWGEYISGEQLASADDKIQLKKTVKISKIGSERQSRNTRATLYFPTCNIAILTYRVNERMTMLVTHINRIFKVR